MLGIVFDATYEPLRRVCPPYKPLVFGVWFKHCHLSLQWEVVFSKVSGGFYVLLNGLHRMLAYRPRAKEHESVCVCNENCSHNSKRQRKSRLPRIILLRSTLVKLRPRRRRGWTHAEDWSCYRASLMTEENADCANPKRLDSVCISK